MIEFFRIVIGKKVQINGMNRNFTALCAAFLLCAILIVFYSGIALKNDVSFADGKCEKVIYLTFDDGPSDRVTPRILDVLKQENVKATFFIVGKNAEIRQNIIKREVEEGHSVGVHSYSHEYRKIYASPEKLIDDIDKCNDVIYNITGKRSTLYRFPGGSFGLSNSLISAVTMHGMRYVDWNASTRDAELNSPTPQQLLKAALSTPSNKQNIVLLAHDTTTKSATANALTSIIRHYKQEGYTFAAF